MLHNYIASAISTQVHLIPKVVLLAVHRGQMYRLVFFWFPVTEIPTQICQTIKETFWLTTEKPSSNVDIRQGLVMAPIRFLCDFLPSSFLCISSFNLQAAFLMSERWLLVFRVTCFLFQLQGKKASLLRGLLMDQKSELCSDLSNLLFW